MMQKKDLLSKFQILQYPIRHIIYYVSYSVNFVADSQNKKNNMKNIYHTGLIFNWKKPLKHIFILRDKKVSPYIYQN